MSVRVLAGSAGPTASGLAGFAAGSLVTYAGVAAALAGWGLSVYAVLLAAGVMGGAAAWFSPRWRWFGVGLVAGCVAELVVLLTLVLSWAA